MIAWLNRLHEADPYAPLALGLLAAAVLTGLFALIGWAVNKWGKP